MKNVSNLLVKASISTRIRALTLLVCSYIWTTYTSIYLANEWGWEISGAAAPTMRLAQIASIPLMTAILFFGIRYLLSIHQHKTIVALSIFYSFVNLLLFILVAPGCFTEDTYYTYHMIKNGWWEGWYSSLHPWLITGLVQIIPWEFNAPGIFLALLWSAIFVFAHILLKNMSAPKTFHFGLFLLTFMPAHLAASLVIVRDSYFTAIFIFFVLYCFYLIKFRKPISVRGLGVCIAIAAFLSFYRSDAIPAGVVGVFFVTYAFVSQNSGVYSKRFVVSIIAVPVLVFYSLSLLPEISLGRDWVKGDTWGKRTEAEYKLTLIENPLGYIVRNDGYVTNEQKRNIEKVFRFEDLGRYWCPGNLCLFYGGHWNRDSSNEEREAAFKSALLVFLQNPKLFMYSRLKTLATVGETNGQTICSGAILKERGFTRVMASGLMAAAGDDVLKFIRITETRDGAFGGKWVWWNVYASAALLTTILMFFNSAPVSAIASLIFLMRSLFVFLAAPAGFTLYYTTLFLGAPLMLLFFLCEAKIGFLQPNKLSIP